MSPKLKTVQCKFACDRVMDDPNWSNCHLQLSQLHAFAPRASWIQLLSRHRLFIFVQYNVYSAPSKCYILRFSIYVLVSFVSNCPVNSITSWSNTLDYQTFIIKLRANYGKNLKFGTKYETFVPQNNPPFWQEENAFLHRALETNLCL